MLRDLCYLLALKSILQGCINFFQKLEQNPLLPRLAETHRNSNSMDDLLSYILGWGLATLVCACGARRLGEKHRKASSADMYINDDQPSDSDDELFSLDDADVFMV